MTRGFSGLDPCVHCGFCLPACPTYLATGDEADSPRGRIVLMRALERGELPADDPALREHLDACLGCRGCEPVCPSGVEYGHGLESAREILTRHNGLPAAARALLALFARKAWWRPVMLLARMLRASRLPAMLAGKSRAGFGMGMLAATSPSRSPSLAGEGAPPDSAPPPAGSAPGGVVVLFRGCIMDGLFGHVHEATIRVLAASGYRVTEAPRLGCCGALHAHAGDLKGAARLARRNLTALPADADWLAVNSAGCGAMLKAYGQVLGEEARGFSARVRDVTELLAGAGPRAGRALPLRVAYDAPCHLQHAQSVHREPLAVLAAIPGLTVDLLPGHDRCCGSAGIYSALHPAMSRAVLEAKVAAIRDASPRPDLVATGNPGCIMQIGAGLRAAGLRIPVVHPVEILDWAHQP